LGGGEEEEENSGRWKMKVGCGEVVSTWSGIRRLYRMEDEIQVIPEAGK
jgi:hypothetical protein